MAITVKQVHQVADELAQQGINPTQMAVRKQLGGGSFSTIGEALKSWRAMRDTNAQLSEVIIPAEIGERAELLVAQIWEVAQSIANERLQNERKALEHKEILMRAEIEEMTAVVIALEDEQEKALAELERTQALLDDSNGQKNSLQAELAEIRTERTHLNDKLADRENHSKELEKRVSELTDENKSMVAEIARLTSRIQFKDSDIKRLTADIDTKEQKYKRAEAELQAVKAELSELAKDKATLTGRADILTEQLGKAESTNQAQVIKIEQLTAEIATLKASSNTTAKPKPKATRSKAVKADKSEAPAE